MHDFLVIWNAVSASGKVFLSCVAVGGAGFVCCWFALMFHTLTAGRATNELLNAMEKDFPQRFKTFYSGDPLFHNRWRLNREFRQFLKGDELDDVPTIAASKRQMREHRQMQLKIMKLAATSWLLTLLGMLGLIYRIVQIGHP
jgi:hypothetical protein